MIRILRFVAVALAVGCVVPNSASGQSSGESGRKTFSFSNGDRIVMLGDTVIEREQRYGAIEPRLQLALGEKKVTVRNLGWSGDTVFGDARAYFGPPQEGIDRLSEHLKMLRPTVVMMCYGSGLAFDGLKGLPDFLTGYRKLISVVRAQSPKVRIIILTPPPLENLPPPMPNQADGNRNLESLSAALKKFALSQNAFFVDLFAAMEGSDSDELTEEPLTENGVHYTREGYDSLAGTLLKELGLIVPKVGVVELEALRGKVVAKDELFFNRWRPQNETYLFGFRKHEQGQNAKEIPMFDPLVKEADAAIQAERTALLDAMKRP